MVLKKTLRKARYKIRDIKTKRTAYGRGIEELRNLCENMELVPGKGKNVIVKPGWFKKALKFARGRPRSAAYILRTLEKARAEAKKQGGDLFVADSYFFYSPVREDASASIRWYETARDSLIEESKKETGKQERHRLDKMKNRLKK